MIFKYFYDEFLAHASYLVGCQRTEEAIIVDPGRDIEQYLAAAKKEGLTIVGVAETHIHADYVSGARELAHRFGVKLFVSDEGPADWKYLYAKDYDAQLLKDADTFSIGKIEFKVLHTPGHTPESISFVVTDKGGGADQPMGIFTGDFVFVGSIGRPDLLEEAAGIMGTAEPGARDLFKSIQRFRELPEYLQVWPTHGAGSACGKGLGAIPSSTVGYELRFNPALQFTDEQHFVDYVLSEQPEAPKYFALMKSVNKQGPEILGEPSLPRKLGIEVLQSTVADELVVDTAVARNFAAAHVPRTVNIQPKYMAMWGGSLIDYERPVYLISNSEELPNVIRIMRKIGIKNIAGYFDSDEIAKAGDKTASIPQANVDEAYANYELGKLEIVDIRGVSERLEHSIPGAIDVFLGTMPNNSEQFQQDKTYVFQCRTGGRSVIAASIAKRFGISRVMNLDGGIVAWEMAGLPVTSPSTENVVAAV